MDIISIFHLSKNLFASWMRFPINEKQAPFPLYLYLLGLIGISAGQTACQFDSSQRWAKMPNDAGADSTQDSTAPQKACNIGSFQCRADTLERCVLDGAGGTQWKEEIDCKDMGQVCAPSLLKCTACIPNERSCDEQQVFTCAADGSGKQATEMCKGQPDSACRAGYCVNLCDLAGQQRSNVGCEYWAVDLDNANVDATKNAAAQQYAVVVSNPQPDVASEVVIEQDNGQVGQEPRIQVMGKARIYPGNLHVFKLGPREVDGSPLGEYDTGPGTAVTRSAFRIRSSVPVVAYQFNPLDNVNVFSNDASLLKPIEAAPRANGTMLLQYVAMGWPQTIADTDNPDTDFDPHSTSQLRAFLTIVATRPDTEIKVKTSAKVVAGNSISETPRGGIIQAKLQPFEVLNLETGDFNADFTGSLIEANQPVLVFSGSEASDAPYFSRLSERYCCADHLEEQIDPIRTAGKKFFVPHAPNRTAAVKRAGAKLIGVVPEREYVRVLSVSREPVTIKTTLPKPDHQLQLPGLGAYRDIVTTTDFMLESDGPVMLATVQASQDAAGVPRGLPGGDPSFMIVPPLEQYRSDYVFLTPDKYAFDFVSIVAAVDTRVRLDGVDVNDLGCERKPADGLTDEQRGSNRPPAWVYRCQLSYPIVLQDRQPPKNVLPGQQNDGVHRIVAETPVLALVYGFDNYVSYGYAAGTQLTELTIR